MLFIVKLGYNFKDLSGRRFGRLTAIRTDGNRGYGHVWICKCDCGSEAEILGTSLRRGVSRSCGCLQKERNSITHRTHGMCNTPTWKTWAGIKARCLNPNEPAFKHYGGRGIKVCRKWLKFEGFYEDMGTRPEGMSIERINNNGNYCKENCKWATQKEQCRNQRSNRKIEFKGRSKPIAQLAEETGINEACVRARIDRHGWSTEDALTVPVGGRNLSRESTQKIQRLLKEGLSQRRIGKMFNTSQANVFRISKLPE